MIPSVRRATVADADAIGAVSVTAWRETYAGIMPADYLAALTVAPRANLFRERLAALPDRQAMFVACDQDGHVVGFGVSGPSRQPELGTDGEVFAINIVNAAKRRRLGAQLMKAMAEDLRSKGFATVGLWVIEKNAPARKFYEALGGVPAVRQEQNFGGAPLAELGYRWPSIDALRDAAARVAERSAGSF